MRGSNDLRRMNETRVRNFGVIANRSSYEARTFDVATENDDDDHDDGDDDEHDHDHDDGDREERRIVDCAVDSTYP